VAKRVLEVLRGDGSGIGRRARERCEQAFSREVALRPFTQIYEDLLLERANNGPSGVFGRKEIRSGG